MEFEITNKFHYMVASHVIMPPERPLFAGDLLKAYQFCIIRFTDLEGNVESYEFTPDKDDFLILLELHVYEIKSGSFTKRSLKFKVIHQDKIKSFYIHGPEHGYDQFTLVKT